jgi:hypothetical protein
MHKGFLSILLLLFIQLIASGQEKIEFSSAAFHSRTNASTLEFFNEESFRNEFLNNLDTITNKLFQKRLNYPSNFKFKTDNPDGFFGSTEIIGFRKKDLNPQDKTSYYLSFEISERPLTADLPISIVDTNFLNELAKKKNICIYQLNAKIIRSNESIVLDKQLFVLLARPDNSIFIGFEHPNYNVGAIGFSKILKTCLPILLDSTIDTELIQITALPAFVPDNFIQPILKSTSRTFTTIKKNFVQYIYKDVLQSIRFQEPGYQPILLKGKNITALPVEIQTAIRYNKRDYIFLWEEGRDVFEDKNYRIATIATVINDAYDPARPPWFNLKTGLPLQFLKGNYHYLIQNLDTIARFGIELKVIDTSKKVYYNQILNTKDYSSISVSNTFQIISHVYHFVLSGTLVNKPFKIYISGISGSSSIKEIYYNGHLVCIAQGSIYPEILSIIDTDISTATLNQLLLMSFSSLF